MTSVIIDTSVLRRDPARRSAELDSIANLAQKGLIKIYIPQIVKNEFITGRQAKADEEFQKAVSILNKTERKSVKRGTTDRIQEVQKSIDDLAQAYKSDIETAFNRWIEQNSIEILEVDSTCLPEVLRNYFEGGPAFKNPKNREDFPDSFIFQTIKKLVNDNPEDDFLVTVNDDNLRNYISELPGVSVFSDLKTLIVSEDIQHIIETEFSYIYSGEIQEKLIEEQSELNKSIAGTLYNDLPHQEVFIIQADGEESETTISEVQKIDNILLDFSKFSYYGNDVFILPFKSNTTVWLDYAIFKSNLWVLPDEEQEKIEIVDSEWNEHYIWVNEKRVVQIIGKVVITVDSEYLRIKSTEKFHFDSNSYFVEKLDIEDINPMERDFANE